MAQGRKSCQVTIDLVVPHGWRFAIFKTKMTGYVELEENAIATQSVKYYFQGLPLTASLHTTFEGPVVKDFETKNEFGMHTLVWSPCHARRSVNINASISVQAPPPSRGFIVLDSLEGSVSQEFHLRWQRCD